MHSSEGQDGPAIPLPARRACPWHPPAEFAELRAERPVARLAFPEGPPGWLITRYDDVRAGLADLRLGARRPHVNAHVRGTPRAAEAEPASSRSTGLLTSDPPLHTRLRQPLIPRFSMRRIRAMRPRLEELVADHLGPMAVAGRPVDVVQALALPLPTLVICELLGVPYDRHEYFQRLTAELMALDHTLDQSLSGKRELLAFLRDLVATKRREPGNDLLSDLVHRSRLTTREIVSLGALMLVAGHETSANMIALGLMTLLTWPGRWDLLRARPEMITNAVEELLRFHTILQFGLLRIARDRLRIGGQVVEPGERVVLHLPSANRDPLRFSSPDVLDLARPNSRRHLGFGHGLHQCVGQQLARVELEVVFTGLLDRFPRLTLAEPVERIPTHDQMIVYGVRRLLVTWPDPS
ncbi:cytochrome P450 [Actinomadura rubrisoli]|uniref:Cytochrome P450 n=1 Tax=Actinomadura rubrisoli TaxID=2530368 RepID=A0A4R5BE07_9ACTN|nr:cytochrome P450 [Actinomadura rubrisoli]TDD84481.1 cytochrome P450 [Actinomadura rubrisoli]